MEITWYGHSCFRITDRGQATVVCDPYDSEHVGYQPLKLKADIVTVSHESPSHSYLKGVKGEPYVITGPGEYEIGGVFITGLRTDHKTKNGSIQIPNYPLSDRLQRHQPDPSGRHAAGANPGGSGSPRPGAYRADPGGRQ